MENFLMKENDIVLILKNHELIRDFLCNKEARMG